MSEVLPPKRQAAVDRLRRRVDLYGKEHQERYLHYERIAPALCEQQMQDSFALKQKYLDPKGKSKSGSSKSSKASAGLNGTGTGTTTASSSSSQQKPATTESTHAGNTQSVRTWPLGSDSLSSSIHFLTLLLLPPSPPFVCARERIIDPPALIHLHAGGKKPLKHFLLSLSLRLICTVKNMTFYAYTHTTKKRSFTGGTRTRERDVPARHIAVFLLFLLIHSKWDRM